MNARRTLGVAGLVVFIAAAVGWYRFSPGDAPAGQPPLVRIDAEALDGLKDNFNRHAHDTRIVVLLSPT